jgi:hypothetical protein
VGDAVEIGEIELLDLHAVHAGERLRRHGRPPGGHQDVRAGGRERLRCRETDARVAAAHQGEPAG